MKGVNRVILIGNVGKDPELRYLPDSTAVCSFSVATSESWRDKATGQPVEQTEWHRISAFGKLAEICGEYLRKGSKVYVEGSLHTRKWSDKQTGQDRYSTEIKASSMQMLDSRTDSGQQAQEPDPAYVQQQRQRQPARPVQAADTLPDFNDDLPF